MAFDDRKTELLACVGCLGIFCGMLSPVLGHLFGWWAGVIALALPAVLWAVFEVIWWRERR